MRQGRQSKSGQKVQQVAGRNSKSNNQAQGAKKVEEVEERKWNQVIEWVTAEQIKTGTGMKMGGAVR